MIGILISFRSWSKFYNREKEKGRRGEGEIRRKGGSSDYMKKVKKEFQVFVKPVGARCNLRCRYCYYIDKERLISENKIRLMSDEILEKYIVQHFEASEGPEVFFSWHGGEPTLAGIDFYRRALVFQKKHKPSSFTVYNGIQTNATLIDEEWCNFLADNNFYAGVSIDGFRELHDIFRTYHDGKPSFQETVNGYKLLRKFDVRTEILCVVNSVNVEKPLEVYRFLKELGTQFITFLPLVIKDLSKKEKVSEISVPSEKFGDFLCKIFDEWVAKDIGKIKIQLFEEAIRPAFNQEHTLCIFKKICGGVPVIEFNGDFYSCDHYVDNEHLIGNINSSSLERMLASEKQLHFGLAKLESLPRYCLECEVRDMCNGECLKNRFNNTPSGEPGLNYLCNGYKIFFNHIKPFVQDVSAEWHRRNKKTM